MRGVLLTGASGVVGGILRQGADDTGAPVRALARDPRTDGWLAAVREARDALPGELVIVHAAIPPQPRTAPVMARYDRQTVALLDLAQELGIDVVLVSTLSIHPGNPSQYVAHKRQVEGQVLRRGGGVVRLGLVRVEGPGSAFTRIRDLARRAPASWVTTPHAVYYVTTPEHMRAWAVDLATGTVPVTGLQACADPRALTLFEAVDVPRAAPSASVVPFPGDLLLGSRVMARAVGPMLDPIVNLRAGMGWIDG